MPVFRNTVTLGQLMAILQTVLAEVRTDAVRTVLEFIQRNATVPSLEALQPAFSSEKAAMHFGQDYSPAATGAWSAVAADPATPSFKRSVDLDRQIISQIATSWFQIRACDALAVCLWIFVRYGHAIQISPAELLVRGALMGGDTDTVAAVLGNLCGAVFGAEWIPFKWVDELENSKQGRDRIVALGCSLAKLDLREYSLAVDLRK